MKMMETADKAVFGRSGGGDWAIMGFRTLKIFKAYGGKSMIGKVTKALTAVVTALTLVFGMVPAARANAATSISEAKSAPIIVGNTPYSGVLVGNSDNDIWYHYVTKKDTLFSIEITHINQSHWIYVGLYDGELNNYYEEDGYKNFTKKNLSYKEGKDIYIRLQRGDYSDEDQYELIIKEQQADNWESEYNDSKDTANTLTANKETHGCLFDSDDIDVYKFTFPKDGILQFVFRNLTNVSDSCSWDFVIYNDKFNELSEGYLDKNTEYLNRKNYKAGTTFYIAIKNGFESSDIEYSITPKFTSIKGYEIEPNDNMSHATRLNYNKIKKGLFDDHENYSDDVDYYVIKPSKSGRVKVKFYVGDLPANMSSMAMPYEISIVDKSNIAVVEKTKIKTDTTFKFMAERNHKYYVIVHNNTNWFWWSAENSFNLTYRLKYKF